MREKIQYNGLPIKIEILDIINYPLHVHTDLQIVYVLEGEIDLYLAYGSYRLSKNQIHFVHSEDVHGLKTVSAHNLTLILSIDLEYASSIYPHITTQVFSTRVDESLLLYHEQQLQLKSCIFLILKEFLYIENNQKENLFSATKNLLETLHENFRCFKINEDDRLFGYSLSNDTLQLDRISRIVSKIYTDFALKLSLTDIALEEHVSKFYLSHLFQQYTGLNFRDFVSMVRVERTLEQLLATNLSVSQIALNAGFSNPSYYTENFIKWYEYDPKRYREKYKHETIEFKTAQFKEIKPLDIVEKLSGNINYLSESLHTTNIIIDSILFKCVRPFKIILNFTDPDYHEIDISQLFLDFQSHYKNCGLTSKITLDVIENHVCKSPLRQASLDLYSDYTFNSEIITKYLEEKEATLEFEFVDALSNKEEAFQNGLLTSQGLKKATYYVTKFLLSMKGNFAVLDDGYISHEGNNYWLLLTNFNCVSKKESSITMPKGYAKCKVTKEIISGEKTAVAYFQRLGLEELTKSDVDLINRFTQPDGEVFMLKEANTSVFNISLLPSSIAMIRFSLFG